MLVAVDTFVVRLWEPGEANLAVDPLRGIALHVASGHSTPFVGVDELAAFFEKRASVRSPEAMRRPRDRNATTT
jgi:hypothetical protein